LALWIGSVGSVLIVGHAALRYVHSQEPAAYVVHEVRSSPHAPYIPAVQQGRSPAVLPLSIPRNLAPSPENLANDQYDMAGCDAGLGSNTSSRICRLRDAPSAHTPVRFGASHARMWMPALLDWAARRRLAIVPLVKEGCTALSWGDPASADPDCRAW